MTEVTRFRGVILKVREVTIITMVTVTVQLNGIMRVRWMEMESGSTIPYEGQYLLEFQTKVIRRFPKFAQSRSRPLLEPFPG